ncbi:MAG: exopolysaccharide biosynthesis protein [Pseudomonadota bacterium]
MSRSLTETMDAAQDPAAASEAPQGATALLEAILDRLAYDAAGDAAEGDFEVGLDDPTIDTPTPEVQVTLGQVFDGMEERGFGLLLLLLALPCCLPFVYLLPQIVAVPMILLSGQLASGRHAPWLPQKLRDRAFPLSALQDVVGRAKKYVGWLERLAHPRLTFLTSHKASRIVGALLAIPCASILVPLPSTNTVPGIGVTIASVGLIERDGLLVAVGLAIGLAWVGLLAIGGPALIGWLLAQV